MSRTTRRRCVRGELALALPPHGADRAAKAAVCLSSGLHRGGDDSLRELEWKRRRWHGTQAYSDSKLHNGILAFAVARHWPNVLSNALEPGWVPTKMGGPEATDDLDAAPRTQVWLFGEAKKRSRRGRGAGGAVATSRA